VKVGPHPSAPGSASSDSKESKPRRIDPPSSSQKSSARPVPGAASPSMMVP
jgi:hypothetical protein